MSLFKKNKKVNDVHFFYINKVTKTMLFLLSYFYVFLSINTANGTEIIRTFLYPTTLNSTVKIGDWVFRKGVQTDSLIVNHLGGGNFSHIGVIVSVHPDIKLIHATTDDNESLLNQVIISDLSDFITPKLAEKYAIARPNFLSIQQQQQIVDYLLSLKGLPFKLTPRENNPRYCTTIIYDAIVRFEPTFKVKWQYVNFPLLNGYYLFPSEFADRDDITWIYRYPHNELLRN